MKKFLIALGLLLLPVWALAQTATPTAIVVATCGSTTPLFVAGRSAPTTVDVNGTLCATAVPVAGGGTSSTFGAAFPATGTASGFNDGTNMQSARVFDLDSGAGTQYGLGVDLRFIASGGSVEAATATNPLIVSGSGTAGTAAAGVLTVQGIASMTPVQVSQATASNLNAAVVGVGTAGTASGGVLTIQGVASMTKLLVTPDANAAVNVAQINGAVPLMGAGNTGTGSPRVTVSTDQAAIPTWGHGATGAAVPVNGVYIGISDGTNLRGVLGAANALNSTGAGIPTAQLVAQCDDTTPTALTENQFGNARLDCATHAQAVEILPSAQASAGIAPVISSSLETGHVGKAGAGNLYSVAVTTTTAAGYIEVFNSTTVPAAGAVTPVASCYVGAFGTCSLNFSPPMYLGTGVSAAFSASTTPFTKTDSATAFFSILVQ